MQSITFSGTKTKLGRKIDLDDPEFVGDYIEAAKVGQVFNFNLGPFRKPKSTGKPDEEGNQMGFFFGQMLPIIMREIFYTFNKDEGYICTLQAVSYELKANPKGGSPIKKLLHISDMDMHQMSHFITECQMWAAQEHGVFLPDPDPRKSKRNLAIFKMKYSQ